jgi:Domain of unknown function (DUF4157)
VHADNDASELSGSLGAEAFTVGNDVYFGSGRYQSGASDKLLAHELTHVVQQNSTLNRESLFQKFKNKIGLGKKKAPAERVGDAGPMTNPEAWAPGWDTNTKHNPLFDGDSDTDVGAEMYTGGGSPGYANPNRIGPAIGMGQAYGQTSTDTNNDFYDTANHAKGPAGPPPPHAPAEERYTMENWKKGKINHYEQTPTPIRPNRTPPGYLKPIEQAGPRRGPAIGMGQVYASNAPGGPAIGMGQAYASNAPGRAIGMGQAYEQAPGQTSTDTNNDFYDTANHAKGPAGPPPPHAPAEERYTMENWKKGKINHYEQTPTPIRPNRTPPGFLKPIEQAGPRKSRRG